jgi:NADH:ubiquinone reductase (H+-translocating)
MAAEIGAPSVVLGAGYAGLAVWHDIRRRSRKGWPVLLVDRHPLHVVRTELYQVHRLAEDEGADLAWALPLRELVDDPGDQLRTGTVESIDLPGRAVVVDGDRIPYGELAICLGSVPNYYHIPGAEEHTFSVYRLSHARKLAQAIRDLEMRTGADHDRPRIVVIGGGSTGVEVAADIATAQWSKIVGHPVAPPIVTLVVGRNPFLDGLTDGVRSHARALLGRAMVELNEGRNVVRVDPDRVSLDDGTVFTFDLGVWAAGNQPPEVIRATAGAHARNGKILVAPTLEIPDFPGAFALGDVAHLVDARSGAPVPATAQAALAEAPIAGHNVVARRRGQTLKSFRYRERGAIVQLGLGQASGEVAGLSVWGRPASVMKHLVERGHRRTAPAGGRPPGL